MTSGVVPSSPADMMSPVSTSPAASPQMIVAAPVDDWDESGSDDEAGPTPVFDGFDTGGNGRPLSQQDVMDAMAAVAALSVSATLYQTDLDTVSDHFSVENSTITCGSPLHLNSIIIDSVVVFSQATDSLTITCVYLTHECAGGWRQAGGTGGG